MILSSLHRSTVFIVLCPFSLAFDLDSYAQPADVPLSTRDLEIRDRYQQSLDRDPYQRQAFDRLYQSYLDGEGTASWIVALEEREDDQASLILLGRIHARRLETAAAMACIEQARELGASGAQLDWLLGNVYADAGRYQDATPLLESAAHELADEDSRAAAIRLLGDTHNRLGDHDAAITAWKLLAESSSGDAFARWDLAGIYEDYALWTEAVSAYDDIAKRSQTDPYAQCRALRSKAGAQLQLNAVDDAIATLEAALALASPGNWLFDDIKQQLIATYEGRGDLEGLADYVRVQVDSAPASIEYRALLADVYTRLDDIEAAESEYRAVLDRAPGNLTAYTSLIRLYKDSDRTEDAADTLRDLIARYPRDTDFARQLGELYWKAGDETRAMEAWRSILDEESSPVQHAELAGWFAAHDLIEEAISELESALDSKQDRTWLFRLAELHSIHGDSEAALAAWNATLSDDSSASDLTEVGRVLDANGFVQEADALYTQAINAEPNHHEARHALATLLARDERHEESVAHFEKLSSATDSEYWQVRGERGLLLAFKTLGTLAAKQAEWEQAVEDEPGNVAHKSRLARLYESRGNYLGAVKLYSASAKLEVDTASHREALAKAYFRSGRHTQAAETYRALLEDQPSRARSYLRELLIIYRRLNNHADATTAAERVVELAPTDAQARVQLAQVYLTQRRIDDALRQYRHAIRLEPDQASLHLLYGEALTNQRQFADARDAYRRLIEQSDDRGVRMDGLRRLASIHVQLNSLDELTRTYESRIRATPNQLDTYAELAAIYNGAEQPDLALQALERAHARVGDRESVLQMLLNAAFDANNLQKTVTYTEELLTLSGTPEVFALVRLGRAYADLGDLDTAVATWARIREAHPDDPQAMAAEAEALFDHGFVEKAVEREQAALNVDPFDSRLRTRFAEHLAGEGELDAALEQYFLALDYGEQHSPAPTSSRNNLKRPPTGFRETIIKKIVALAGPYDAIDPTLERFERARLDNPESQTARNDLIAAYESLNRLDDVIALAKESLAEQPDDTALIEKLGNLYAQTNQHDAAAETYLKLAELEPTRERHFKFMAARFYQRGEDMDAVLALYESMLETKPTDYQVAMQLASVYGTVDNASAADALFAELRDSNSRFWQPEAIANSNLHTPQAIAQAQQSTQYAWASYLETNDRKDEAVAAYELMLNTPDDFGVTSSARSNVYQVSGQGRMGNLQNFRNTMQRVFPSIPYMKTHAVTKLIELDQDIEVILKRANKQSDLTEESTSMIAKFRIASQLMGDYEAASQSIQTLLESHPNDLEVHNALLLLHEQEMNFDAVTELYEKMEHAFPQHSATIERSIMAVALQEGDFDRVARALKAQLASGTATNQIVSTLNNMHQMGGKAEVAPILEEMLKNPSAPVEAIILSSRIRAEQGDIDGAIALAREALDRAGGNRATSGTGSRNNTTAQIFQSLRSLYSQAGRSDEYLAELRAHVEANPRSIPHRKRLAEALVSSGQGGKGIEQYEAILEQRPRDTQTMLQLANHYSRGGSPSKAFELCRKLLKIQPGMYRQIYNQLMRLNLGEDQKIELAAIEERIIQRATNASDIIMIGHFALQRKDRGRAIALFKRALVVNPGNVDTLATLAGAYVGTDDYDQAKKMYEVMLNSSQISLGHNLQYHYVKPMVSVYATLDVLPELIAIAETFGETKRGTPTRAQILSGIARHEERYGDAIQLLRDAAPSKTDHRFIHAMVEIAQESGDPDLAIEILERAAEAQPHAGYWNQIAQQHIAQGNKKRAAETWVKQAILGSSIHDYSNAFQSMLQHNMFDEAEAFYIEHRKILRLPRLARSVEQGIVRSYMRNGAFEEIVKTELLTTDNPRLENFIQTLAGQVRSRDANAEALVEAALELAPDNPALLHRHAQILTHAGRHGEAASVWARVVELQPNNSNYRHQYAGALAKDNRRDEAAAMLTKWAEDRPTIEAIRALVNYLNPAEDPEKYRALRDRILARLDVESRETARTIFAPLDTRAGDLDSAAVTLREQYEQHPGAKTFRKHFLHQFEYGSAEETAALLMEYSTSSSFDAKGVPPREAFTVCFRSGGHSMANELLKKMLTHAGGFNFGNVFREVAPIYEQYGAYWRFDELIRSHIESNTIERKGLPVAYILDMFHWRDAKTVIALAKRWFDVEDGETDIGFAFQLLQLMNEPDTIRALLDDQHLRPVDAPSHAYALANAYHKIGDIEKRDDAVEFLLSQDEHSAVRLSLYNALEILQASGDNERIVTLIENRTAGISGEDQNVLRRLGRAYIGVGRYDDALAIWEKNPDQYGSQFAEALMNAKAYAQAVPMFEYETKKNPHQPWYYAKLAKAVHLSGETETYRESFRNAMEQMSNDQQRNALASVYAQFLRDQKLIVAAIENDDVQQDETLAHAIITCLSDGMFNQFPDAIPRLMELMPHLDGGPFANKISVGYRLVEMELLEDAARWFHMAADESAALNTKLNAAQGLKKSGYESDALDLIESLIDENAVALMNSRQFFNIVAMVDDEKRGASIAMQFHKHFENDSARKHWEYMRLEASGDQPEELLEVCESLADSSDLTLDLLLSAESRLTNAGRCKPALSIAERVANGPYKREQRDQATRRAMGLAWCAGDFADAIRYFSEAVLTQPTTMREVRRDLFELVDEETMDGLSTAATEFITASPTHPAVTELIHMLDELSETGLALDSKSLIATQGIPPETIAAIDTRASVIENWQLETHEYETTDESIDAVRFVDTYAEPRDDAVVTDNALLPGAVMLDRLKSVPKLNAKSWLVARTSVDSASSKPATLTFGSCHHAVSVWINGEPVFRQHRRRDFNFDQNRIAVVLREGANEIVVQLYQPQNQGAFALGVVEID